MGEGIPEWLYDAILRAMTARGLQLFTGPGEVSIVYVEGFNRDGTANDNIPNKFNDVRFVLRDGRIVSGYGATTEPGKRWTTQPMNSKGAARIAFGQYSSWQVGMHRNNHEALVQSGGPVTVHRDYNKDYKRAGDKMDTGYFGINQHHGYDYPVNDLGSSSAGCLVGRSTIGHREFMRLCKDDPRYRRSHSFVFTATILPAAEIVA